MIIGTFVLAGIAAGIAVLVYAHKTYVEHVVTVEVGKLVASHAGIIAKAKADITAIVTAAKTDAAKVEAKAEAIVAKVESDIKAVIADIKL